MDLVTGLKSEYVAWQKDSRSERIFERDTLMGDGFEENRRFRKVLYCEVH